MSSDLLTELEEDSSGFRGGRPCQVCLYLNRLPEGQQAEWRRHFRNPAISHSARYRALTKRGVLTSVSGVKRHGRNHA